VLDCMEEPQLGLAVREEAGFSAVLAHRTFILQGRSCYTAGDKPGSGPPSPLSSHAPSPFRLELGGLSRSSWAVSHVVGCWPGAHAH
jgi:hypothetical protein